MAFTIPIYQVDAFAAVLFAGNPAAVCPLESWLDDATLQAIAAENNLAETAFFVKQEGGYALRWFTPTNEVDLCGHATLAAAHVLFEDGHATRDDAIRFDTKSGRLTARSSGGWIEMDFPAEPAVGAAAPAGLLEALGIDADATTFIGRNRLDWLVAIDDAARLRAMAPDLALLATLEARGVIVTAPSDDKRWDFLSRYFAPAAGVPEDPVTGSAHCCLAGFWAERLDRNELVGYQASARGGEVRVRHEGSRVMLTGQAVRGA